MPGKSDRSAPRKSLAKPGLSVLAYNITRAINLSGDETLRRARLASAKAASGANKKRPRKPGAPDFPHSLPRLPFNPSLLRRRSDDDPRYRPAISGEAETGEAERHQRPGRRLGDARDSQGKAARIIVVSARVWAAAE